MSFWDSFGMCVGQQKFENLQAAQEVFEEMAAATRRSAALGRGWMCLPGEIATGEF